MHCSLVLELTVVIIYSLLFNIYIFFNLDKTSQHWVVICGLRKLSSMLLDLLGYLIFVSGLLGNHLLVKAIFIGVIGFIVLLDLDILDLHEHVVFSLIDLGSLFPSFDINEDLDPYHDMQNNF